MKLVIICDFTPTGCARLFPWRGKTFSLQNSSLFVLGLLQCEQKRVILIKDDVDYANQNNHKIFFVSLKQEITSLRHGTNK